MSDQLPNRWLKCPPICGKPILDKFIAFKTPLSSKYDNNVPEIYRFTPSMVFDHVKTQYKKKIGLWINLTNTTRYYDKTEIQNRGCKYEKMSCRGHGETPSTNQTETFLEVVNNFIDDNPNDMVAVHCTHGFNRTGFLLCAYMVLQADMSLEDALHIFSFLRSPGIYKQDYIDELIRRFENGLEIKAPERPDWCDEEQLDYDDDDREMPGNSQSEPPTKRQKRFKNKKFMIEHENVILFTDTIRAKQICSKANSFVKWKSDSFPGAQPVSMDLENIKLLIQKPYQVSWKADGVRYMMLIEDEDEVYMIDRDNCLFRVHNLRFPHNTEPRHLKNTLLDGEMVIDKVDGRDKPRYLVYDIIRFDDINVGKQPFYPVRLHCIEKEIIKPRNQAIINGKINKEVEPFSVIIKRFWDVSLARQLLEDKFIKTLHHDPDGLIFQPADEPYTGGPCKSILKWKPGELNSIDFKLFLGKESGQGILSKKIGYLYVGGNTLYATIKYSKELKDLNNKIIECKYDNGQWVYMRERTDKSFPNSYDTAWAVQKSIRNPVTKEHLFRVIEYEKPMTESRSRKRPRTHNVIV